MKDSLFSVLLNLFEKTIGKVKKSDFKEVEAERDASHLDSDELECDVDHVIFSQQRESSVRIFTPQEQFKFTKASYQFIMRLMQMDVIAKEVMEHIINQLFHSDSPFVTLEETQWTIRQSLEEHLEIDQRAFLDVILADRKPKQLLH